MLYMKESDVQKMLDDFFKAADIVSGSRFQTNKPFCSELFTCCTGILGINLAGVSEMGWEWPVRAPGMGVRPQADHT